MKVSAAGAIRAAVESWGWEVVESGADAILQEAGDHVEIRAAATVNPDDIIFLPLTEIELRTRIGMTAGRHARLARRLHNLRSPLNAIQGYAEMIAESAEGDVFRFASNIRTASETLTSRLEAFREEGV